MTAVLIYKRNCEVKPGMLFPQGMARVALGVEYQGASLQGFQKQATSANTVQENLDGAISHIANEKITTVCAGRTDAGVHAVEQVVHFDTLAKRPLKAWVEGVNTRLPDEVRVHWAQDVGSGFHARFCAKSRTYRYILQCGGARSACLGKLVTWTRYDLDVSAMEAAGRFLLGEHDFSSFRASQCQAKSPIRCIDSLHFFRQGGLIIMEIKANAFLHHMVRNIVGAMIDIGRGAREPVWMNELLQQKDRTQGAPTAKPWGLYFVKAEYDKVFNLPSAPLGPPFLVDRG